MSKISLVIETEEHTDKTKKIKSLRVTPLSYLSIRRIPQIILQPPPIISHIFCNTEYKNFIFGILHFELVHKHRLPLSTFYLIVS